MLYRDFATQEEIDRQYDVGTYHPAAPSLSAAKITRSREARATLTCKLDVAYGPRPRQKLDVFPAAEPGAPVLVFIHGGYWKSTTSTKETHSWVALGCQPRGITTVVVEYDLCPGVTIDTIVAQVRDAVAWVRRHIADYGGDPRRIHVAGSSAGGHLTAMVAATDWEEHGLPPDTLSGATGISGLYDLAPFEFSFLQPVLHLDAGRIARNSPLGLARPGLCPLLLLWGGDETSEFERQARAMQAAWSGAGNAAALAAIPGRDHYSISGGLLDPDDSAFGQVFWPHLNACWARDS
ncbi:alpha/beta hydrolase [Pseudooceanicola sp.]|uniref:alpha/beta hydrolase n=1 Tax=Pseudooceanicola sp. TaxID=1914328 RepID=UPI00260DBFAF|nr:alpha/beta hydrolase [Pseudooceanicola sp.]MDF1856843.1 alpha/beta hydrolase [Pseudooceanicola sp.]